MIFSVILITVIVKRLTKQYEPELSNLPGSNFCNSLEKIFKIIFRCYRIDNCQPYPYFSVKLSLNNIKRTFFNDFIPDCRIYLIKIKIIMAFRCIPETNYIAFWFNSVLSAGTRSILWKSITTESALSMPFTRFLYVSEKRTPIP